MKSVIVLAMHGSPPNDFPKREMAELFDLRARLRRVDETGRAAMERRLADLEAKMRDWPRTAQNDPYHAGSRELAACLSRATRCQVIVGFNEFCAPSLDDALNQAAALGPEKVVVVTPMMTRGGEHSEVDIPDAVRAAQQRHPRISIVYVWPFEVSEVAEFLATQIRRHL